MTKYIILRQMKVQEHTITTSRLLLQVPENRRSTGSWYSWFGELCRAERDSK